MPAESYAFLLDATARKRIQIAKLGDYSDPGRYGDFSITADEVKAWAANLAKLPGGRAPIDADHAADKPGAARVTRAAGWITGVSLEDGVPTADVEWTPFGEKSIADKEYLFISPSYGSWQDERGNVTPDVLYGAALTNKPFLDMPTVCLSKAPVVGADATERTGEPTIAPADSRAVMPTISPKILEALGLTEDADEAKALSAITTLTVEPKSLETQATEAGKVLVDADKHKQLEADAGKAGALEVRVKTLESERADDKFEAAFDAAKHALDAKPETKDTLRELFDANQDSALKLLSNLAGSPSIVPTTAKGLGGEDGETDEAPAGVDADAHALDQKAQAHIKTLADQGKTVTYLEALAAVQKEL